MQRRNPFLVITASLLAFMLFSGFFPFIRKKKYEAPISKDTMQPDKVLFDRAIKNIEKGNYEVARLTLNTLINTYDTSEFLAKANLAIADSWYREGGAHGLAQAEQAYKDFILFFPNMEEAAQSQFKVCEIHYKQMEKADRDNSQATRAEDECRQVLNQFPNSKYAEPAKMKLLQVQEVLADKEYGNGHFYFHKGSFPAAASRFAYVTTQYPLYSGSDQALWELADSYRKMGDRFENEEAAALTKIVKDYPFSSHVDGAKERLTALKRSIPQADPAAYAHQKYEMENRTKQGMFSKAVGVVTGHPDTSLAAKSGTPAMTTIRPMAPVSVPASAAGGASGVSDVVGGVVGNTENLDKSSDVRLGSQNGAIAKEAAGTGEQKASVGSNGQTTAVETAPPPTNHPATAQQIKDYQKAQAKAAARAAKAAKKAKPGSTPAPDAAKPADPAAPGTPASATTPGTTSATTPPAKQ